MKALYVFIAAALAGVPFALHAAPATPASATQPASAPAPVIASSAHPKTSTMPKPPVPKFKQADANHDGKISRQEAKALGVPKKIFDRDDFDKSGDLNETEWMFVRLDMTDFTPRAGTTPAPIPASSH
jgi:hypothetical protein